ncbi:transcription cofactor vestigial-like protein 4 isoform X2 [Coccinella septempunctata]|uniref:transcription cofactor vestigial-like protein 4 isoform X2 n=1 Tax=Coccinella septempunctata TaxID=41139 RepID=UPI001D07F5D0|nr:transcription cofactor vestigial-like protein 4 isoform X2 [Coccinella septempunctata]
MRLCFSDDIHVEPKGSRSRDKMEDTESPLDVLSRAATMLQENQDALSNSDDFPKDCSGKHLSTTKWRRERRSRLPEYSRTEGRNAEGTNLTSPPENPCSTNGTGANGFQSRVQPKETPLDMSVRQRGLPPSYAQTVNNPGYRSSYRPATLSNGPPPPPPKEEIPAGISMCDPIIDEHFRRSLGENYQTLYLNNNSKDSTLAKTPQPANATVQPIVPNHNHHPHHDIGDLMDDTGLSVDDHFAKALGETWLKLNKKQQEIKGGSGDNLVSI